MTAIGRVFLIFFALIVAAGAAGLVIVLGTVLPDTTGLLADMQADGSFTALVGLFGFLVWGLSLVPALLMIVVLEAFAIRSILVYGILGGVLAMLFLYGSGFAQALTQPLDHMFTRANEVVLAAGIAGGMAYWLVAGRSAGRWRRV
ncbi:MAG TPA: hypothetical protein VL402_09855 [Xanthobacteraceae bacterium]|jgi:hypothetical protein|nr:hypothetical protein [Xanthobacteraceae bacterium]